MPTPNKANRELHKEPPKRAVSGRSMRLQVFMAFDLGMRPTDVTRMINLSQTTAFRYFQQWKKMPPLFKAKYKLARKCFHELGYNDRRIIARALANELGTTEAQISAQLGKPWAIRQIVTGEWKQWPVKSTCTRHKTIFNKDVRILLSLLHSREVRYILEMAINQNINPFEK